MKICCAAQPKAKMGRPPLRIETILRIRYQKQGFGLSDPAMEEVLQDVPLYRELSKLEGARARLPDETTILRFRDLLGRQDLAVDMLRVVNDLPAAQGPDAAYRHSRRRAPGLCAEFDEERPRASAILR